MFKKIVGTTGTRILNSLFTVVILWLFTHYVGSKGYGAVALIVLDITVIQMFIDPMAGSALVYFSSRTTSSKLVIPAYFWVVIVVAVAALALSGIHQIAPAFYSNIVPGPYGKQILILALINGIIQINYNMLIGKGKIKIYNLLFTTQIGIVLIVFAFLVINNPQPTAQQYIIALFMGWGISAILGFAMIVKEIKEWGTRNWQQTSRQILHFGFISFTANLLHLGNKRFSFYLVTGFAGLSSLGVYNAGLQLTEGIRIIGQSISLVQYSVISNSRNETYAIKISIQLMKISVILTFLALLVLLLIPTEVYGLIFSRDFIKIKEVIIALFPGVLSLSANTVFSHYFSGKGHPEVNLRSNIAGFVVTLIFLFLLIPKYGITGAAITASLSYFTSVVYQYIVFKKQTGTKVSEWLIRRRDFHDFFFLFKSYLHK